jgi:hypothetical protein
MDEGHVSEKTDPQAPFDLERFDTPPMEWRFRSMTPMPPVTASMMSLFGGAAVVPDANVALAINVTKARRAVRAGNAEF